MIDQEAIIDSKLINKFVLHQLANNGGSIKLNGRFGIRIVYNDSAPDSPMVELRLFAIPMNTIYKGNINPSMVRAVKKHVDKKTEETIINTKEAEEIIL